MTLADALVQIHHFDLLLGEATDRVAVARLKRLGFPIGGTASIEAARLALLSHLEPRWLGLYERALRRYGAAIAMVRGRVCQGCHMTLPRSAAPAAGEVLTLCQSCGRILYWI